MPTRPIPSRTWSRIVLVTNLTGRQGTPAGKGQYFVLAGPLDGQLSCSLSSSHIGRFDIVPFATSLDLVAVHYTALLPSRDLLSGVFEQIPLGQRLVNKWAPQLASAGPDMAPRGSSNPVRTRSMAAGGKGELRSLLSPGCPCLTEIRTATDRPADWRGRAIAKLVGDVCPQS